MSDSLQPHQLQDSRLPCPSPTPGDYPNSGPSRWWCHPTISSSVIPFSSHLQSFSASGSFPMRWSSHHVVKVLEFQLQYESFQWIFRTDLVGSVQIQSVKIQLVGSPCSPRDSQESSTTQQFKSINSSVLSFLMVQLSNPYMMTGKP